MEIVVFVIQKAAFVFPSANSNLTKDMFGSDFLKVKIMFVKFKIIVKNNFNSSKVIVLN